MDEEQKYPAKGEISCGHKFEEGKTGNAEVYFVVKNGKLNVTEIEFEEEEKEVEDEKESRIKEIESTIKKY